jgi:hypothetical protein
MTGVLAADGIMPAFIKAFGVTTASEVGDNTFFMVAVMSMKNPWYSVSQRTCSVTMHAPDSVRLLYIDSIENALRTPGSAILRSDRLLSAPPGVRWRHACLNRHDAVVVRAGLGSSGAGATQRSTVGL